MAKELTSEQAKALYEQITVKVYDIVDHALDGIERSPNHERAAMLAMIQPMLDQARSAADVIGEHFLTYYELDNTLQANKRDEIEKMLRYTFMEFHAYMAKLHDITPPEGTVPGNPAHITSIDRHEDNILRVLVPEMPHLDQGPGQSMVRQERIRLGDELADRYEQPAADIATHFMHLTRALHAVDEKYLVRDIHTIETGAHQTSAAAQLQMRRDSKEITNRVSGLAI